MRPVLPQNDVDPTARGRALTAKRDRFVFAFDWPPLVATLAALPLHEEFSPGYIAKVELAQLRIAANHAAIGMKQQGLRGALRELIEGLELANPKSSLFASAVKAAEHSPRSRPDHYDEYHRYFARFEEPPLLAALRRRPQDADLFFAWQRIAGANPMMIERISAIPDDLEVDQAVFARTAVGQLDGALAEGRIYLADYRVLAGVRTGLHVDMPKYLSAPKALYVVDHASQDLTPVAIQVTPTPDPEHPVLTPADGWRWRMAKACAQSADANVHEAVVHLARTHMVMEAVGVSMHRQLAPNHPLYALLDPHLELTFAINNAAKSTLIGPGGVVDTIFAATINDTVELVQRGLSSFVLQDFVPQRVLAARGVDDTDVLPVFPYRDDLLSLWGPVHTFARDYVALYYTDESSVQGDQELAAFVAELGSPEGGRLSGIRPVQTRAELAELLAVCVLIASAQHAAVNFSQWPYMSVAGNMPGAIWAPPPGVDTPDTEAAWMQRLPPWDAVMLQGDVAWQLTQVRMNTLGYYDRRDFRDPRVQPLLANFRDDLEQAERTIDERELSGRRLLPYPFLKPSQVPASIHI